MSLEIKPRFEGFPVEQGISLTTTPQAYYFYFRLDRDVLCVRYPRREHPAEIHRFIEITRVESVE